VGGKAGQKEILYFMQEDGIWKINESVVTDKELEGKREYI